MIYINEEYVTEKKYMNIGKLTKSKVIYNLQKIMYNVKIYGKYNIMGTKNNI